MPTVSRIPAPLCSALRHPSFLLSIEMTDQRSTAVVQSLLPVWSPILWAMMYSPDFRFSYSAELIDSSRDKGRSSLLPHLRSRWELRYFFQAVYFVLDAIPASVVVAFDSVVTARSEGEDNTSATPWKSSPNLNLPFPPTPSPVSVVPIHNSALLRHAPYRATHRSRTRFRGIEFCPPHIHWHSQGRRDVARAFVVLYPTEPIIIYRTRRHRLPSPPLEFTA
jgi:hypothetical protein